MLDDRGQCYYHDDSDNDDSTNDYNKYNDDSDDRIDIDNDRDGETDIKTHQR
jgi:hypothetical protein